MKSTLLIAIISLASLVSCTKEKTAATPSAETEQTHCPVSGEKLGSMGEPVVVTHEGATVKLCCDSCLPKFEKDPSKYAAVVKNPNG